MKDLDSIEGFVKRPKMVILTMNKPINLTVKNIYVYNKRESRLTIQFENQTDKKLHMTTLQITYYK